MAHPSRTSISCSGFRTIWLVWSCGHLGDATPPPSSEIYTGSHSFHNPIQSRPADLQSTPLKGTKLSLFLTARLCSYSCVEIQRSPSSGKPESSTAKASRAFRHSAPVVWNNLSANTRCATSPVSFKQLLKTELFAAAFGG